MSEREDAEDVVHPDAWLHDGEWARVGGFYVYPRDGLFFVGRPSGAHDYRDVDGLPGFENMQAAIDHARWMADEATAEMSGLSHDRSPGGGFR